MFKKVKVARVKAEDMTEVRSMLTSVSHFQNLSLLARLDREFVHVSNTAKVRLIS